MADGEVVKLILQGGSFGLMAIIVVWMLFYGAPMLKAAVESKDKNHTDAFERITTKFEAMQVRQDDRHERELTKRDGQMERIVTSLDALTDRIENVERRTDEFPIPPPKPRRPHP